MSKMSNFEIINDILVKYEGNEETVLVPDGVRVIKNKAFQSNKCIKKVILPKGLVTIQDLAFQFCSNLEEVHIPDTVTTIGVEAFQSCYKLKELILPPFLSDICPGLVNKCYSLEKIVIPDNVSSIGCYAFARCKKLKDVHIPRSVEVIAHHAFYQCENLEQAIIPDRVKIHLYAFDGCRRLKQDALEERQKALQKDSYVREWVEDNMDEMLEELVKICAYWADEDDNEEIARKAEAYFVDHMDEDERYVAAYCLVAAEHAQNHDPDEGFFPLDKACKIFARYDAEECCRDMADELDLDTDIEVLMNTIKFYMLGL